MRRESDQALWGLPRESHPRRVSKLVVRTIKGKVRRIKRVRGEAIAPFLAHPFGLRFQARRTPPFFVQTPCAALLVSQKDFRATHHPIALPANFKTKIDVVVGDG